MMRTAMTMVSLLLSTVPVLAQVTARQGTAPEPDLVRFDSPMVLEVPLKDVRQLEPGTERRLPNLRKYVCDGDVSLISLAVEKVVTGPRKQRGIALAVTGAVFVGDSYDRWVDIGLRLIRGEKAYASGTARSISAEEERATPFRILIPLTDALLDEAFTEGEPKLELTLTVRDNS